MAQAIIANRDAVLLENFAPIMRSNYSDAELLSTHPLRRFFHTYIVASIVAVSTAALFAMSVRWARALRLPNSFDWQDLGLGPSRWALSRALSPTFCWTA
jgi:hypothetical protein